MKAYILYIWEPGWQWLRERARAICIKKPVYSCCISCFIKWDFGQMYCKSMSTNIATTNFVTCWWKVMCCCWFNDGQIAHLLVKNLTVASFESDTMTEWSSSKKLDLGWLSADTLHLLTFNHIAYGHRMINLHNVNMRVWHLLAS